MVLLDFDEGDKDIKILTGDYKKAIRHIALPIAFALAILQINILVDTSWVAGLGVDAMASISIVYPVFAAVMGIGSGLGIGASVAIARSIGKRDKREAEARGGQALLISILVSVVLTPILLVTMESSIILMGGSEVLGLCMDYAIPLYLFTFVIIFNGVITGVIRGEGAAKRSMYIQVLSAVLNIIFDPILIYGFGMGVAGAAWATVIAFSSSIVVGLYWYFIKKDMFLKIRPSDLKYSRKDMSGVLRVGFPEAIELSVMNLFNIFLNFIVIVVMGTIGVALYSTGWRVVYLLMVPAQAVGVAIVSVCSAQYGAGQYTKIRDTFLYGMRTTFFLSIILSVFLFIIADIVAVAFTYEAGLSEVRGEMAHLIRIFSIFVPAMSVIYTSSSILLALDRANIALASSFLRNVMLIAFFAIAAYIFNTADSLWWSFTIGEIIGGVMMLSLALWKLGVFERSMGLARKL
jgi:putative MATE family efflux protein